MADSPNVFVAIRDWFWLDPLRGAAAVACLIAMATIPIAFVILSRGEYLYARRGRTYRKPEWWSVVCAMALVMGVPGIVLVLLVKSQYYDEDRYAFDPNDTWSVVEQGRQYQTAAALSEAAEAEYTRLQLERKQLVEGVKALDEAMIPLRGAASTSISTAEALPEVLARLAPIRKAVGVDAPQQLLDETAPPVELAHAPPATPFPYTMPPPGYDWGANAPRANPNAAPPTPGPGLTPAQRDAELAKVPDPQRDLAALLPLSEIPQGWEVGESGDRYLESFNAENLYEKIDGRAESFLQYDVVGMAYTFYHPEGDPANEVQLYIFEMASPLKALGKYGTEKPGEVEPLELGAAGYASGTSVFFHAKTYYVQIVPTSNSEPFRQFALDLGRRISNDILPGSAPDASASVADVESAEAPADPDAEVEVDPAALFALLPEGPDRTNEQYVAQDVFGYAFLADVFMASYADDASGWQAFVRPYASPERALEIFEQYRAEAEAFDAVIQEVEAPGADAAFPGRETSA